jgi:hypothetical protein
MNQKWIPQEEKILSDMANAGLGVEDVMRVLKHRSRDSISQKAGKMKLSLAGKPPEIDMKEFKRLMEGK